MADVGRERAAEVAKLVDALRDDAVFAMSLGSKELFHSNLLGWFLRRHRPVAEAVLPEWTGQPVPAAVAVEREKRNLDLLVRDGQGGPALLVVENKTFSLPDDQQLADYTKAIKSLPGQPARVLLSLVPPDWPGGEKDGWSHRSYTELQRLLAAAIPAVAGEDDFDAALLKRWVHLLGLLEALLGVAGRPTEDEQLLLPPGVRAELAEARLDVPVQKMRCAAVASRLRARHGSEGLRIVGEVSNGVGMVTALRTVPDHPVVREVGWQLQGEDLRLALVFGGDSSYYGQEKGKDSRLHRLRAVYADRTSWFSFAAYPALAGRPVRPGTGGGPASYNRYDPDFIYRYVRVGDLTAGQIVEVGNEILAAVGSADLPR